MVIDYFGRLKRRNYKETVAKNRAGKLKKWQENRAVPVLNFKKSTKQCLQHLFTIFL
jgi:hypothetical protein